MNNDARREHYYHLIFQTKEEETSARIHDQWIKSHFPQARMQSLTSYPVKVNCARATAILNPLSGHVADNAKEVVSNSNNGLKVSRVGWLSCLGTGKLYGSMVVCLAEKKYADLLISQSLIKIGGETAYTEVFHEQNPDKKRCFNCQQYGHRALECNRIPVCGNCSFLGHFHRNCQEPQVCCSNCSRNHPANSFCCPANPSTRYSTPFPTQDKITHLHNAPPLPNSNEY